jgi:hypothetical protein
MSEVYRISGNGYHDWENMRSVAPDDWRPAAPPKSRPSRALEAAEATAEFFIMDVPEFVSDHSLFLSCKRHEVNPACKQDQAPRNWPSTGLDPKNSNDKNGILKIKESDLNFGVEVLYYYDHFANCDGFCKNMEVFVPELSSKPYPIDENGRLRILATLTWSNWPPTGFFSAELRYWDPVHNKQLSDLPSFPLWRPQFEKEDDQYRPCDSNNPTAGGLTSPKITVKYNETARISAYPTECDATSDHFKVDFYVNGKLYGPTLRNGNEHYIEPRFTQLNNNYIYAWVQDILRNSDLFPTNPNVNIFVEEPEVKGELYASPSKDGWIARRPMTVLAGSVSGVPEETLNFDWEIRDPQGQIVPINQVSNREINFLPMSDGVYSAKLTITGDALPEPIVKTGLITIFEFPPPEVFIAGDQNPSGGASVNYKPILLPHDRAWGPEDEGAKCTWKLSHIANGQTVIDFENVRQDCSAGLNINFPNVVSQTSFVLEVDIDGADDSYHLHKSLPITVWPASSERPKADFGVFYDADGAIPFREVNLQSNVTNASGILRYVWEIRDSNSNLLPTQPGEGKNSSFEFSQSGIYDVRLMVYQDGGTQPIARANQTVTIYPFPEPNVDISVNNNAAVYSGKQVALLSHLCRPTGDLWPEEINAQYNWKITHKGYNGSTGQFEDIVDLDPASPEAQVPNLFFTFNESTTYSVKLTVTGISNGNIAYIKKTSELLDVYRQSIDPPAFSLSIPDAAPVGTAVPMSVENLSDPNWTISWNFGDGQPAGSGASVTHIYYATDKFNIVVTLTSTIDPSVKIPVPFTITIY